MDTELTVTSRRIALPDVAAMPHEALAALLSGVGLALGFLTHDLPMGAFAYCGSMVAGGIPALPAARSALRRGQLDVHVLMLTAAIGAALIGRTGEGASLLFLFALSGALEAYALGRTKDAIRRLVKMRPTQARREDGSLVAVESLVPDDTFVVHPAEAFPLDGIVVSGFSSVDQSVMTGESEPVSRGEGDRVVSGTLNLDGIVTVRATVSSGNTALERVIALVAAAQDEKSLASSERLADRVGRYYAPVALFGALIWFAVAHLVYAVPTVEALYRALTLLVAASPCALVISSPAAVLSALASAGRHGLLIRSGSVLETLARVDTVAFDKTGTLTTGKPTVRALWSSDGDTDRLLTLAASAEAPMPHPLAQAIVRAAAERGLAMRDAAGHRSLPGRGVTAEVDNICIHAGLPEWVWEAQEPGDDSWRRVAEARAQGSSVVAVQAGSAKGLIMLEDTLRPEAAETLSRLRAAGVRHLLLLTGDHRRAADALHERLPMTEVRSDLRPEDKAAAVRELSVAGRVVAMVGDGVNDAPALAGANVGITLGGIGSDVALDSADVVVMEDRLLAVPEAIRLARRARRVALQNVVISLLGVSLLSLTVMFHGLPLPLAVLFHEGTTVLVVLNGLRLLL